ncbi:MAG: hypothetical protein AB1644_10110 [Candidatus Zixiibacteriota bacterium]
MRRNVVVLTLFALLLSIGGAVSAQETEQEILQRYLSKAEKKQIKHQGWFALNFAMNRINRHNDYNSFADYESQRFTGTNFSWLNMAKTFGAEFGMMMSRRMAFSLGGEYWLKMGETVSGSYLYQPISASVSDPASEIKVYGGSASLLYYFANPPTPQDGLKALALRSRVTVGYYRANWSLWADYQNLNLSTSLPEQSNLTFKGTAPALTMTFGGDYPIGTHGFSLGAEFGYQYLNFNNVSWYNDQDQEVVVTYAGTPETRVDLGFSGFIGKVELKKLFTW